MAGIRTAWATRGRPRTGNGFSDSLPGIGEQGGAGIGGGQEVGRRAKRLIHRTRAARRVRVAWSARAIS